MSSLNQLPKIEQYLKLLEWQKWVNGWNDLDFVDHKMYIDSSYNINYDKLNMLINHFFIINSWL